jgi:hypothetical protein
MGTSRFRVAALLPVVLAFCLAWSIQVLAGQFYITSIDYSFGTDMGDRMMVRATSVARYQGAVDIDDTHWQIGASVRPAFGVWHDGTPKNGGAITRDMIIVCDYNSCGGNAFVDKCTSTNNDNSFTYKGEVAISNNQPPNEEDERLAIGYMDCPTAEDNGDGADDSPFDDYNIPSPILIDIERDHYDLTGLSDAVFFDIDGDGDEEVLSWTESTSDDAFLALDRNGNGIIDSGRELFGNFTDQPPSQSPNGFAALTVLDEEEFGGDEDGAITPTDLAFYQLLLWTDSNHDGYSQTGELEPLSTSDIEAIEVDYVENGQQDQHGNWFRWKSKVHFEQGVRFAAVDVIFVMQE